MSDNNMPKALPRKTQSMDSLPIKIRPDTPPPPDDPKVILRDKIAKRLSHSSSSTT